MNWKRFTLIISSCTILAAGIVMACADYVDPYDDYPSFFFNNINPNEAFEPYYFTTQLPYYSQNFYWHQPSQIPDENLNAWYEYTHHQVTKADIDSLVYKYRLGNDFSSGIFSAIPEKVKNNGLAKWMIAHGDKDAIAYLIYAKDCERNTPSPDEYSEWDHKWLTQKPDTPAILRLEAQGIKSAGETKNSFIKERYQYQAIRMAFYCNRNKEVLQLYKQFFNDKIPTSVIGLRCVGMKAGALFRIGKNQEAAYLYSLVFDHSDAQKQAAHISFMWATSGNVDTVLNFCHTNHERAVLYIMKGLYEIPGEDRNGLTTITKAYAYDPNVTGLDVVMTREINKAEQRYLAQTFSTGTKDQWGDGGAEVVKKREELADYYKASLAEMNTFAQKVAADGKNYHKAYWELVSAYIYFMQGDESDCKKYLDIVQQEKMTDIEHDVHDVINTLYIVRTNATITASTEAQLLPSLQWIEQRADNTARFGQVYSDLMNKVLAPAYLKQRDTIKAIYCLSRTATGATTYGDDDYTSIPGAMLENMSTARLQRVEAFVNNANKSAYEQWLTKNSRYDLGTLQELEATQYIRLHQFDKAANLLAKVPAAVLNRTILPDILVSHLTDYRDWNKSDSANTYTKLTFAQKMVELEQKLKQNPNDSRTAYQYANALYNITYYGKACHAKTYFRSTGDGNAYYTNIGRQALPPIQQEYYNARLAEKYYMVAFNNSTDPEFKARCVFLAAKCWQKNCQDLNGGQRDFYSPQENKDYYENSLSSPYFKQLKDGYAQTKFYGTAVNTCSYLRDYLKKN